MARRYGASIEQSYQQADELLGDIVSRLASSPDALIMVISDHGFASTHADSKWSGEHVGRDGAARPGLIVANKKLIVDDPQLMDIAPSVLKHLGVAIPGGYPGRPLF
jgi:arylsulfatase A-like enzyme